jgi:hypothetical protein
VAGSSARRIECIARQVRGGSARVERVGGLNADSTPWSLNEAQAIREIEAGTTKFYCDAYGQSYLVVVGTDRSGVKLLKAAIDGDSPECLLRLPDCR